MKGTFKLVKPGEMEATLSLTARVSEWQELEKQLTEKWPSHVFARIIRDLVRQVEAGYFSDGTSEP